MNVIKAALVAAALLFSAFSAKAQVSAQVVASCGIQSYSNGQLRPVLMDLTGTLCVTGGSGGGGGTSSNFAAAFPNAGTALGLSDGTNMRALSGINYSGSLYAGAVSVVTALPVGTNAIGSITNTTFGISGTLPAFTATPTVNLGTLGGGSTSALQTTGNTALTTINTTLGTPFQAGASIGNSTFGISGTLPAYGSTPTFNLGTLNGAATAAKQPALGTAGTASTDVLTIQGIASMTALKVDGSGVTQPISAVSLPLPTGASTSALQSTANTSLASMDTKLSTINTTLNSPFQAGGSIGNTSFGISGTLPAFGSTPTVNLGTLNGAATAANQAATIGSVAGGTAAASSMLAGGVYNTAAPTLTNGQQAGAQFDVNGNLKIAVVTGGGTGGTSSSFAAAFPALGTALGVKNGANMVNLTADGSNNLNVNCTVGCAGGSVSNAASNVATSTTNNGAVSWLYGFNGATWDQLQVDGSKYLKVAPQGTTTITGTVTANIGTSGSLALDTTVSGLQLAQGSTTSGQKGSLAYGAVTTSAPSYSTAQSNPLSLTPAGALRTDSSAVTQPISAASLPLPSGAATAAGVATVNTTLGTPFQAGGSIGNSAFGITGAIPAGTNVIGHVVADTGSTTAVTQATATNLKAQVVGTGTFAVQCTSGCSTTGPITPVVAGSGASSAVLLGVPGSFYGATVTPTVSGYIMMFNAVAAPSNGGTTAGTASGNLQECIAAPANATTSIGYATGPAAYTVGVTLVFSSTGCATLTASASAFINGRAQ